MTTPRPSPLPATESQGAAAALGGHAPEPARSLRLGNSTRGLQQVPDKALGHQPLSLGKNRVQNAREPPRQKDLRQALAEVLSEAWVPGCSKPRVSIMFPHFYNNHVLLL